MNACTSTIDAERRFNDVAELQGAGNRTAARAVLEVLLTDCDAGIRKRALESLKRLDPVPSTTAGGNANAVDGAKGGDTQSDPPDKCPGPDVWKQRFEYADHLREVHEYAGAQAVLESALDDCSKEVRQNAADDLVTLPFSPPPGCPDEAIWHERFEYADDLRKRDMIDAARAVLSPMLDACNEGVRKGTLSALLVLPHRSTASATTCAGYKIWEPRLLYGNRLKKLGDITGSHAVLAPALADCDASVRDMALSLLMHRPPSLLLRRLTALRSYVADAGSIALKVLVGVAAALLAVMFLPRIFRPRNRRRLIIDPLEVVGGEFHGLSFNAIVDDLHERLVHLDELQIGIERRLRTAVPSLPSRFRAIVGRVFYHLPRPTWIPFIGARTSILDRRTPPPYLIGSTLLVTSQASKRTETMTSVATAFAGDGAAKVIAAVIDLIGNPCYRCSGRIFINETSAQIRVRVERFDRISGAPLRAQPRVANLDEHLRRLALASLNRIATEIRNKRGYWWQLWKLWS